jgi:DNA repair protein RecN (Recombination protein N)
VGVVLGQLRHLEDLDPSLAPMREDLLEAQVRIEEAERASARRLDDLDREPGRLDAIEERLKALEALARRHGSLADARSAAAQARDDLGRLEDESDDGQRQRLIAAASALETAAAALSNGRNACAARLTVAVGKELTALGFPGSAFEVELSIPPDDSADAAGAAESSEALLGRSRAILEAIGNEGRESVRFLLAPNPGEGKHALGRTAAGGELSRVMLALRTALRGGGGARVLVFDEVDSGVGGAVLDAVADRLEALSADRQVLCVTHQARVAARARLHLQVDKHTEKGRTATRITVLDRTGRLAELERLLVGGKPGPRAAALAEDMLDQHAPEPSKEPSKSKARSRTGRTR